VQLIVDRVRGKGGHAGRVFLWVADEDPYSGPPLRTPLLDVECWRVNAESIFPWCGPRYSWAQSRDKARPSRFASQRSG
ncbi:MAG: segregation ATPase FtsK/SpoIIIE, family, partial [Pseudonocardiales bacterium]|nr:segregation ATPase FtsK/SpoIIIE, family [Pseudonocardiales bacterium]